MNSRETVLMRMAVQQYIKHCLNMVDNASSEEKRHYFLDRVKELRELSDDLGQNAVAGGVSFPRQKISGVK